MGGLMNSRLLTVLICTASMMACQASTDAVTTDASAEVAETITNSGQASNVPASASGGRELVHSCHRKPFKALRNMKWAGHPAGSLRVIGLSGLIKASFVGAIRMWWRWVTINALMAALLS